MKNLANKKAVILGGTSGIGLATAEQFIAAEASVIITGRSKDKLRTALEQLGNRAAGKAFDAANPQEIAEFFSTLNEFDYLLLATGTAVDPSTLKDISEADFRRTFDEKFWLYIRAIKLAYAKVRESITLLTGAAARTGFPELTNYNATNAALEGMILPMTVEFAPIRINAVSAGVTDTPFWAWMPADSRKAMYGNVTQSLPVGRVATAEDIAEAMFFAATNRFTTGTILACDGGVPLASGFSQQEAAAKA